MWYRPLATALASRAIAVRMHCWRQPGLLSRKQPDHEGTPDPGQASLERTFRTVPERRPWHVYSPRYRGTVAERGGYGKHEIDY